jgi:hypothetical protein
MQKEKGMKSLDVAKEKNEMRDSVMQTEESGHVAVIPG